MVGQGRLASYGLPLIGEGPGAKLEAASPRCAIARTASDPVLRTVQGGTAGRSCEEETVTFFPTVPGRWVMVRRDSTRSRPVVLAALRALHLDGAFADRRGAPLSGKAEMCWDTLDLPDPAGGVVGGPVAGQRVGDPVRAVRQRAGDDGGGGGFPGPCLRGTVRPIVKTALRSRCQGCRWSR